MSIESLEHVVRSRVKMFLRHTWFVTVLGTLVIAGTVWGTVYYTTKATVMRVAAGPPEGVNAQFVRTLSQTFAKDRDKIQLKLVPTEGARDSAQAFATGRADLAVLPSTAGNSPDWPVVAILRQNVVALIVPAPPPAPPAPATPAPPPDTKSKPKPAKGSKTKGAKPAKDDKGDKADKDDKDDDKSDDAGKLTKVPQLAGHRIGIVTGNEATREVLDIILNHYGVPLGQVQVSLIDPKNLADAVSSNQIDVIFVAGSATGAAIAQAVTAATRNGQAPTFIEVDQADGIAARNPAYGSLDVDAGTFGGNPPAPGDSLKSLTFAEYLVARRSFGHDSIALLARLIYTSRQDLAAQMPGEVKIAAPPTDKDAAVNVHVGALAYLTDNQQDFFDKYGNEIFYGMLIFPVIGSGIAAAASYFKRDSRTRRLRLLQRVLDLVRKAHAAQSLEALDQLQIDADNLVVAIIHQSEHEEFEESVRMSFAFALDQLRFAIAGRRTSILDRVGSDSGSKAAAA